MKNRDLAIEAGLVVLVALFTAAFVVGFTMVLGR